MSLRGTIFLMLAAVALPVVASADDPPRVTVHIDPDHLLANIPDDFLGFGYETSAVAQPRFFSPTNTRMINLYRTLSEHGLIRIGGNISDHTEYQPTGMPTVAPEEKTTIINQQNLQDLAAFARATGWHVMWGLNLGTGSKEQAVTEAVAVSEALGDRLHSFEIGNEVDLLRRFSNHFDAYHAAYTEYKSAIRQKLPNAVFSGPDVANSFSYVEKFVDAEASDMGLITHHYYRADQSSKRATMEYLLAHDDRWDTRLTQLQTLANAHHLQYRINETNSFSGGGKPGVSDTFAGSLWALDYLFNLAAHGCSGVNMETDINQHAFISSYSPIVHDEHGVCSAAPEYYGILAFAHAAHGKLLTTTVEPALPAFAAYTTQTGKQTILTLINKSPNDDVNCDVSNFAQSTMIALNAPDIHGKDGITFAGTKIKDDGTWKIATTFVSASDTITVPHASAIQIIGVLKN